MKKLIVNISKSKKYFDILTDTQVIQWEVPYSNVMTFSVPDNFETPISFMGKGNLRTIIGLDIEAKLVENVKKADIPELPYWMYPILYREDLSDFYTCQDRQDQEHILAEYARVLHFSCCKIPAFSDNAFKGFPTEQDKKIEEHIWEIIKSLPIRDQDYFYRLRKRLVRFVPSEFAEELIKKYHFINVDGAHLFFYKDGYYQSDFYGRKLEAFIYEEYKDIKYNQKREVISCLKAISQIESERVEQSPYVVNVKNGVLDLSRDNVKFYEHSPEFYCFNQLPVTYNPDAPVYDVAYKSLDKTFNYNKQIMALFEEILGMCLVRDLGYSKAFVFVGEGGCGKSTVIDMIQDFLGEQNYTTLSIEQLQSRFAPSEIEGKLANFADDINYSNILHDTGLIKNLISGQRIRVERKGEQGYSIKPYATQIWGANGLPKTKEMNYAIVRRFVYIPFVVNFTKGDPDYDPDILDKLKTEECKTWLLNIAIKGLNRYRKTNHLTKIEESDKIMQAWVAENSPTQEWVEEEGISVSHVTSILSTALYTEFRDWAEGLGINKIPSNKAFYKEISRIFNVERSNPIVKNNVKGRFFESA